MKKMNKDALARLQFEVMWESPQAIHSEMYDAVGVSVWRDCLPDPLIVGLEGKTVGETIEMEFEPGSVVAKNDPKQLVSVKKTQFNRKVNSNKIVEPRAGRFYPKGLLKGISGIYPQNVSPFRCVEVKNGGLRVDFNHPLAKAAIRLRSTIREISETSLERGGRCYDWMEIISAGPGMQIRWENKPTEFFSDNPFGRIDNDPDTLFYQKPRLVQHIDDTAAGVMRSLYGQILSDGMQVLDLMSSWQSHIPGNLRFRKLSGLGLNEEELKANRKLDEWVVHDLNEDPVLPYADNTFDAVICSLSIEYIIHPETVFAEIARVLKPGGVSIVSFSDRWFPTKAINIWEDIHEFERMGLVLEYFLRNRNFSDIRTYSARGLPRPVNDKYFPEKRYSDPIYAVWGRKIQVT